MKKEWIWLPLALVLTGCAAEPEYETIGNIWDNPEPVAVQGTIEIAMPDGAKAETMEGEDSGDVYSVGEWEIWTQVCSGGDIHATVEQVTGLDYDTLTVLRKQARDMICYETVWSTTQEDGLRVGRTAVLDDGNNHYCVSVRLPEEDAGELEEFFTQIFSSVTIRYTDA